MSEISDWVESQEFQIPLDAEGKIIDFLNPDIHRPNTPEERIRQKTAQLLVRELGYRPEHMSFERSIHLGRERRRADIVIYEDARSSAENDQGQIDLIIETKSPDVSEPDGQLISYLSATSARGGFWTNGEKSVYYRKDPNTNRIINWLGLPKFGQSWDSIGKYSKGDLIEPVDLKLTFRRCHNAMYRTGIDSEDLALDMTRIILAKLEDESSSNDYCEFHITPEEYGNKALCERACGRVRALFENVRNRYPDVFGSTEYITASDNQLALVISQLQQYSFLDAPYDVIGTAYETYVASSLKGERGQYFTNRLVVNMLVRMAQPKETDIILDPCCGSGGFILTAMNHLFNKIDDSNRSLNSKEILKRNVVHRLFGTDISPKLVKVAKANMLLAKDGHGGIEQANSLDSIDKLTAHFRELAGQGKPSIILTNPPFGSGHDLRVKEDSILTQYKIGHQWNVKDGEVQYTDALNSRTGVAPEVLYVEKCLEWVKEGGIVGLVMAKGQLDNREAYAMRKFVTDNAQILAVINLHEDTFEPFTGAKASVILLRKHSNPPKDYRIFMGVSNKVGQTSRGVPILKCDQMGNPVRVNEAHILDEDLTEIADDYLSFIKGELKESEYRFSVSFNDLNPESLSFNPIQYLPQYNAALKTVLTIGDSGDFEVSRLGDIATAVFNGPRFKRPYADKGVTTGKDILPYYTGTALTQRRSENIKYLDRTKADKITKKYLDKLVIHAGYVLISDSGTLGRITYALTEHEGVIATNNLIRVVIEDLALRGYVYKFLQSDLGQDLVLKNSYGTNQEHLEPHDIAEIPIPVPRDREVLERIGLKAIASIEAFEASLKMEAEAGEDMGRLFAL